MGGMIVAPQPIAVEEGAKVLMAGGNAVDAAVTCALVQSIVSPQMCGIGGYAILTMSLSGAEPLGSRLVSIDAPALAGSRVTPDMWADVALRPNPDGWGYFIRDKVNDVGYRSICAPGTVRALFTMLERWGTTSWAQAIAPAARIAQEGFTVSAHLAAGWQGKAAYPEAASLLERIQANDEARRVYLHPDGTPYAAGETFRNPDYARTLGQLAERGPDDIYHGELARRIAGDLAANDSYVTADDLAAYQIREPTPVVGTYRGYTVFTAPPPHGGPTLLAILNILEGYDLAALGHNSPAYIHLVSMAMKAAFADRNPHLADPEFVDVPVDWMISKERAAEWRQRIDADEADHRLVCARRTARHDAPERRRRPGQLRRADPLAGLLVGRDHARPGVYVQQLDGQFPSLAGPSELDRAAQIAHHGHDADHRLQGRSPGAGHRRAGRDAHHYLGRSR